MTESMNIIDYCKEHKIKTLPIKLEIIDGKKTYLDEKTYGEKSRFNDGAHNFKMNDFNKKSYKECAGLTSCYLEETEYIAIDTSTIHQLDIDDPKWWNDKENDQDYMNICNFQNYPYFTSVTKKCPHYFYTIPYTLDGYKKNWLQKNEGKLKRYNTSKIKYGHDVLQGQWSWTHKEQVVENATFSIPSLFLPPLPIVVPIKKNEPLPLVENESQVEIDDFCKSILDNIDNKFYYKYPEWSRFIWAIKFKFGAESLSIANHYSKALDNYKDEEDVKKYMDSATEARIGWGYLMNLSKKSDLQKHYLIIAKHTADNGMRSDDYTLATIAIKLTENDIIRDAKNRFYVFKNPYWVIDKYHEVRVEVCNQLRTYFTEMKNHYSRIGDSLKSIECDKIMKKINSSNGSKAITEQFCIHLQQSSIVFDTYKPYFFCFNNCAFDLQTNKQVNVKREDYISQTTGYDYRESTPEELALMKKLWKQIFPKEDNAECYASVLRAGMIGLHFEKFVMAHGQGGNGKGLLNSLLKFMLGKEYYYLGNVLTLTEKQKSGANQEIADMHKKRAVIMTEPDDEATIRLGTLKGLTGDANFNARELYSKETNDLHLQMILILEMNKKPKINGRIDNAAIRRFVLIYFESLFTEDKEKLEIKGGNYYQANANYKKECWQQQHKFALFDLLMTYTYTQIYEPVSIKKATHNYLCENSDFTNFMDENFKIADTEDKEDQHKNTKIDYTKRVKLKDMCNTYKCTYLNQNSRAYRLLTRDKFLQMLKEDIKWSEIVRERFIERYRNKEEDIDESKVFIGLTECCSESDIDSDHEY